MRPVASVLCCYLRLGVEVFLPVSLLLADCVPSDLGFLIPIVSCQPAPCGVSLPSELLAVFWLDFAEFLFVLQFSLDFRGFNFGRTQVRGANFTKLIFSHFGISD